MSTKSFCSASATAAIGLCAFLAMTGQTAAADARSEPLTFPTIQLAQANSPAKKGSAAAPAAQAPASAAQGDPIEGRITELHQQLKISQAQEPQFKAFADVMRSNSQDMQQLMKQSEQKQNGNAVEELRNFAQFTDAQANGLKRLVPVFQTLYDSLSDPQKKVANTIFSDPSDEGSGQNQSPPRSGRRG